MLWYHFPSAVYDGVVQAKEPLPSPVSFIVVTVTAFFCFAVMQLPDFMKRKVFDVWRIVY